MYAQKSGSFALKVIYWKGEKWWLAHCIGKNKKHHHTHIPYDKESAARMIIVRANKGVIPKHYPNWMVDSINRLWFGKDYLDRKDLNNDNLFVSDPKIRYKKESKHGHYYKNDSRKFGKFNKR